MYLSKNLTNELKTEHKQIVAVLENVKKIGISSDKGKALLLEAKKGLLSHLQKEDDYLYPALNEAAKSDSSLEGALDRFSKEMKEIASVAMAFFDKYGGEFNAMEFSRDFGKLYATLGMRINREESVLYSKYDELTNKL